LFFTIAWTVIFPAFLVMALGYLVAKYSHIEMNTLSKINFHIFIPVFMFYALVNFKQVGDEVNSTITFNLLLALCNFAAMAFIARLCKFGDNLTAISVVAVMIFNSANYGIPVIKLAYQGDGEIIQVMTIAIMNILTFTVCIFIVAGWKHWRKGFEIIFKFPIIYALAAALIIRGFDITLPQPITESVKFIADGMVSMSLLTLGAQLGHGGINLKHPREIWITAVARLLLGPAIAFILIQLLGYHGLLAKVLFVSSAFPSAVATVLLGIEYKKEPTYAADVVLITTLLSAVTVTGAIAIANVIF
jgi:predicted permease